jgi:Na+/proline symporter/signal transduction histidine kinase
MLVDISLDLWIIIIYLLVVMIIGVLSGSQIKNVTQFAVADKNFTNITVIASIFATFTGGVATSGVIGKIHNGGPVIILFMISPIIQRLIIAYFLAPNIDKFKHAISAGDISYRYYNKSGKIVTGIFLIAAAAGAVAAQISILADIFNFFFGVSRIYGAIIGAGTIILYSTLGGIKAVTITDLIQFFILIIAIPAVCNLTIMKAGGYGNLFQGAYQSLADDESNYSVIIKYVLPLTLAYSIPFHPVMTQRLLIAKDSNQIKYSMLSNIPILLFFIATITFLGLAARILFPEVSSETVFLHTIDNIMPVGLKGLAIAGYLAVIMSTADSYLNAISVSLINDIFTPIYSVKNNNHKLELFLMKLTTILVGISGVIIALHYHNVLDIVLKFEAIWYSTILFPILFSFFNVYISRLSFKFFIAITVIFYGFVEFYFNKYLDVAAVVICMPFSFMIYIMFYIWDNNDSIDRISNLFREMFRSISKLIIYPVNYLGSIREAFNDFSPNNLLDSIATISYNRVSEYGGQYYAFSAFAVINYLLPYFLWSPNLPQEFYAHTAFMRVFAGVMCIPLILCHNWPPRYQKYLPLYWHLVLMYSLPLLTTCFLLLHGAGFIWFFNLSMSLMFLLILVDWQSFMVIAPSGMLLGYLMFIIFGGSTENIDFNRISTPEYVKYEIVYMFVFMITIVGVFARNKQEAEKKLLREKNYQLSEALAAKQRFLNNLNHELRLPLQSIGPMVEIIEKHKKDINSELAVKALDQLVEGVGRMENITYDILDLASYYGGDSRDKIYKNGASSAKNKYKYSYELPGGNNLQSYKPSSISSDYKFDNYPDRELDNTPESSSQSLEAGSAGKTEAESETSDDIKQQNRVIAEDEYKPSEEYLDKDPIEEELNKQGIDFSLLISNAIEELKTLYKQSQNSLANINYINKSERLFLFNGNFSEMCRAIRHVIDNAAKYSNNKDIDIYLSEDSQNKGCLLQIKDRGLGIPENEIDGVFEPFTESSRTAQKSGGKGIGLSLAKEIIETEGGTIWAENNTSEDGCSVYIYLNI